jgi:hypothetical protein
MGPKVQDAAKNLFELQKIGRFLKVSVHAQPVSGYDIFVQCGAGEHDDRNDNMLGVLPEPPENIKACHAGHFEVHENNVRNLASGVLKRWLSTKVRQNLPAVSYELDGPHLTAPLERELKQLNIRWCILRQKNVQLPLVRSCHCRQYASQTAGGNKGPPPAAATAAAASQGSGDHHKPKRK